MDLIKKLLDFFLSLRTTVLLLLALLCILFYGSFIMPSHEEFQALHTVPLFTWLQETPGTITWWLWTAIGILSLLTANTICCSLESLTRKRGLRHWLIVISPQVVHIGFLFILLAHLLSSYGSFKGVNYAYKDATFRLPNGLEVVFRDIHAGTDPSGYITEWSAEVEYFREGRSVARDVILPNSPSFMDGVGIYIKTVKVAPFPVALIEVSREPGAPWALLGGIFFLAGMITLLILKIRREEALE